MNRFTDRFTETAREAMEKSREIALNSGEKYIGSEHILLGILWFENSNAAKVLISKEITYNAVRKIVNSFESCDSKLKPPNLDITPMARTIIKTASKIAENVGHELIGTEHILISILEQRECVAVKIIQMFNVSVSEIKSTLYSNEISITKTDKKNDCQLKQKPVSNIIKYAKNLCALAREGKLDPVVAREKETDRLISILCRRTKNNPCLVGEPGVGKTAIVEGLAQRISERKVPEELQKKDIYTLELSSMIAGAKYRGDFEDRMKGIIDEVKKNKDIILFIDEIHTIVGAGSAEGAMDAANIIKPALARAEIQVIGATTYTEYIRHIEKDAALERRFQSVYVCEPSTENAKRMIYGVIEKYQNHHGVRIDDDAIDYAINLSVMYLNDKYLPDKAIDIIDEACSNKRLNFSGNIFEEYLLYDPEYIEKEKEKAVKQRNYKKAMDLTELENKIIVPVQSNYNGDNMLVITKDDIVKVVSEKTGIPIKSDGSLEGLKKLDSNLKDVIKGQDEQIDRIVSCIKRGMTVMKSPMKPIGSFLFLGPSGVGKTQTAISIAKLLFDREGGFIRLDMSEFMEQHSISKLIGSPPGYVGYDDGGILTKHVRRHPYCVVLFDEIEKAHKDVYNILLQVLDAGRLTDSKSRTVDFSNTVIIMTSNFGNRSGYNNLIGFYDAVSDNDKRAIVSEFEVKKEFSAELINRIDEIVYFNDLSRDTIFEITKGYLNDVAAKANEGGIQVRFSDSTISYISNLATSSGEGARNIERCVKREIENIIARAIVEGELSPPCCLEFLCINDQMEYKICEKVSDVR